MSSVCFHCHEPLVPSVQVNAVLGGTEQSFCCEGCLAVASTIEEGGLSAFYQYRSEASDKFVTAAGNDQCDYFDSDDFAEHHIKDDNGFSEVTLLISGMHCTGCTWLVEHFTQRLDGVDRVIVNLSDQTLWLRWDRQQLAMSELVKKIHSIGFHVEPFAVSRRLDLQAKEYHQSLRRLGVAGLAMMQVGMMAIGLYAGDFSFIDSAHRDLLRLASLLIASVVIVYSAKPFFVGAWRGLITKSPGMDVPVGIALLVAYVVSVYATINQTGEVYFDTVVMFTFLLSLSRFLEMRARHFSSRSTHAGVEELLPQMVHKIADDDSVQLCSRRQVAINDKVLVRSGDMMPVDGVCDSDCQLDESQLTGEFRPIHKKRGDTVLAGSINVGEPVIVRVSCEHYEVSLYKVADLLDGAKQVKPAIALLADHVARYFVLAVLLLASLTYLIWHLVDPGKAIWITLSVLVVSCPCALSLATPAVIASATQRLRQFGLLVTQANTWELIPKITHVIFDKTGTLTLGKLQVEHTLLLSNQDSQHCFDIACALERFSEHPIANAFNGGSILEALNSRHVAGSGVEAEIEGITYRLGSRDFCCSLLDCVPPVPDVSAQWILLVNENEPLCWFGLNDVIRPGANRLVEYLQQSGLQTQVLSGDSSGSAEHLAKELGIDQCYSGKTAEEKLQHIQSLQHQGATVLMVGDGINDIPVLAGANASVAMTNASDLAKTQADIILLSGQLNSISTLFTMGQSVRSIIRQNLFWALSYNFTSIPLAMMGLVPPYLAAIGMSLSSLLVVANALRLYRWEPINSVAEGSSKNVRALLEEDLDYAAEVR